MQELANTMVVTPWHNEEQLARFLDAWSITGKEDFLVLQQDKDKEGCARTKNKGIRAAAARGAEFIIVLDDDCYPSRHGSMVDFMRDHVKQLLLPHEVTMFRQITAPASRGTPYYHRTVKMRAAAVMGFWTHVGDYDAPGQLVHGQTCPMVFEETAIHGQYFPLCGMNLSFRASELPWCLFVDVPRFDDIWQGFIWQRKAYAEGMCFATTGPHVKHSRQSNVWANLRHEAENLQRNETLWSDIMGMPLSSHSTMLKELGLTL